MYSENVHRPIIGGLLIASSMLGIAGQSTLKAVSMLTRHGNRAPDSDYPLNPYLNYEWPGGLGALSPKGVRQLYLSGMIKSRRYASLLVPSCSFCNFDINKVYAQSSAKQRCIDSGISFLTGFLPIPYPDSLMHVTPMDQDEMLGYSKACLKYDHIFNEWKDIRHPAYSELIDFQSDDGKQFIEYLQISTGTTIQDILDIADSTQVQLDNGLELPEWTKPIFDTFLVPLFDIGLDILCTSTFSDIRSGVHLKDIMDRLSNFISGSSEQNILFYSAHDANVLAMLHYLDVRNQTSGRPAYGSMFNMEIYDNPAIHDDYEIKLVYFMTHGDENPVELDIPSCQAPCPLRKYEEIVESKFTLNHDEACSQ